MMFTKLNETYRKSDNLLYNKKKKKKKNNRKTNKKSFTIMAAPFDLHLQIHCQFVFGWRH